MTTPNTQLSTREDTKITTEEDAREMAEYLRLKKKFEQKKVPATSTYTLVVWCLPNDNLFATVIFDNENLTKREHEELAFLEKENKEGNDVFINRSLELLRNAEDVCDLAPYIGSITRIIRAQYYPY